MPPELMVLCESVAAHYRSPRALTNLRDERTDNERTDTCLPCEKVRLMTGNGLKIGLTFHNRQTHATYPPGSLRLCCRDPMPASKCLLSGTDSMS